MVGAATWEAPLGPGVSLRPPCVRSASPRGSAASAQV